MNTEPAKPAPAERIHHPYSPSKLQCLEACPKYDSAFTESEAATMGTMQHDVADSGVDNAKLPDYKALAVVECMEFVEAQAKEFGPGCIRINEEYLPIDDETITANGAKFIGTTAGYLDVGLLTADGRAAKVIDYKFGQVEVEDAGNNLQGIAYMLGLWKRFPQLQHCTVFFLMPHRDQISYYTFYRRDFERLYLRVKTVVARAVEANKDPADYSMANPTTSSCLFCSRLGQCPKVAALALKLGKKYAPLVIPDSISTSVFTDPKDAERGLKFSAVIKVWAEAYRTQVTQKTISDDFVPEGYQLVSMQKRNIKSAKGLGDLAKKYLPPEMQAKVESLYEISLGPLEKLISTAAPRGEKEKTVEAFGQAALDAGHLALGDPFAFLRMSNKKSE